MTKFLSCGGELASLTRAFDWASTPLGPATQWPDSLKTTLGIVLASNHPMFIWWGPDLIQFYNDAYRKTMGPERHPSALIALLTELGEASAIHNSHPPRVS